ncbi:MAG: Ig-like domain-containing protein [Bacteroidota bacterium]|nr:Ig-like domain-containing protein [Bacteroidota bacterium]
MNRLLCIFLIFAVVSISFAQPPNNLTGLKICIDPGHGGNNASNDRRIEPDPGNVFWESEGNFRKALWLRTLLQQRGATVFLTRETNTYPDDIDPTLTQRWEFANTNNVNWFHSIHSNAGGGLYTMVLLKENISTRLPAFSQAVDMSSFIYTNIRAKLRTNASGGNITGYPGVYKDYTFYGGTSGGFNLGVLNGLVMPGELSEGSFHDGFPETRRLLNNDYRKTEAYGILNGFVEYYKIPYDTLGMIIGSQKDGATPINNVVVRLLPNNKIYNGDIFNNGFFLFDSLPPGNYKVVYETPGFSVDTVSLSLIATPKLVKSSLPEQGKTAVSRTASIVIEFLQAMDTALVRTKFSTAPIVEGIISWSNQNKTLTFTPKNPLGFYQNYDVTLVGMGNTKQPTTFVDNKTVTTTTGLANYALSFQTEQLPPYIILTQPKSDDTAFVVSKQIGIKFSVTMDTASVRAALSIVPLVGGTFSWSQLNTTLLITPTGGLPFNTNYTVTIGSEAKSIYGKPIDANRDSISGDPFIFKFRTQSNPLSVNRNEQQPMIFSLNQNYPNPFNPSTTIGFSIAELSSVSLAIYDVLGREVSVLVNEKLSQGEYSIQWDAKNYSSGMYLYKLATEKYTSIKRMMLVK